jgi:nitrous oxide reductase
MAAADLALATANLVAFNVFATQNIGVTYSSGSADYAEWLERSNPAEKITPGDIVGVYGGKVTKYTGDAHQLMVISTKPAISEMYRMPVLNTCMKKLHF